MLKRLLNANLVITLGFLVVAVVVLAQSRPWPFRARLFPLMTGTVLLVLVLMKLVVDVVTAARPATVVERAQPSEDEEEDAEIDVFGTASPRAWISSLGWTAAFFLALWLLGALIAIPLFAFVYLLVASHESLTLSSIYAFACWAFVYGLFDRGLNIPLPAGALLAMIGR